MLEKHSSISNTSPDRRFHIDFHEDIQRGSPAETSCGQSIILRER